MMTPLARIVPLVHTIKYLRWKQMGYRIYYFFLRISPQSLNTQPPNPRQWCNPWDGLRLFQSTLTAEGEMTFLGVTGAISTAAHWNSPQQTKLWLYNLHYFNALNTIDAPSQCQHFNVLIQRWIDENPPLGGIGWQPYPLSLRIVNWIKWFSQFPSAINHDWLISLTQQVNALAKQVEYHILANHLLANAKALVFAGTYFTGALAEKWLSRGLFILDREIDEQFLSDGGHFELSPMYHACLLWDLCDLVNLAQNSQCVALLAHIEEWQLRIQKGLQWLFEMSHPDGEIAFFNDVALGIAPSLESLIGYAEKLGITFQKTQIQPTDFMSHYLQDTGYAAVYLGNNSKAILDLAKIGPDYQPGHAHADTLSFELSLYGQRVFVNSGISEYGEGPLRQWQRGTFAHNTVSIDGAHSSEVWAGFRVARRAYPQDLVWHDAPECLRVRCAHNGYQRLPGDNIHAREWLFLPQSMRVSDQIQGTFQQAEARFYFHPDVVTIHLEQEHVICHLSQGQRVLIKVRGATTLFLETTQWYPYFGSCVANRCLVVQFKTHELITEITW